MYDLEPKFQSKEIIFDLINELTSIQFSKLNLQMLLNARGELQQSLFNHAREVRNRYKMDFCMLRGVIEISNYCQKHCAYCAMRATNREVHRYRMTADEILDLAEGVAESGITTLFLQSGQDPKMDPVLEEVIPEIRKRFNQSILLCVGERKLDIYQKFRSLGADSYILKYETSDPELFSKITQSDYYHRLECIYELKKAGFKVGVGNIIGLPNQTLESITNDMLLALQIKPEFVSSAPFIPNQGTPLMDIPYGDFDLTLNWIALSRILLKTCLIPTVSALEKIRKDGQLMGLNAGANIITINFTPPHYREKYNIYNKKRFVVSLDHALSTAERAGLRPILKPHGEQQ